MIEYIAPYPVLLVVLVIGAAIVASRKPIMEHAEGAAARVSPDRLTRGVMRTVARFAVFMGWLWVALAAVCIVLKLASGA